MVVPQGHDENHSCVNGLLHGVEPALLQEIRTVLGDCDPVSTEVIGDGAMLLSVHGVCGVLDSLAILLVELPHLRKLAVVGTIVGDELSGHSNGLGAIDLEIGPWTEEVVRAQPVWLDVATVLVAQAAEAILTIVAAVNTLAASLLARRARVHSVGHGHLVCLPDVDLRAATSVLAG